MASQLRLIDADGNERARLREAAVVIGRDGSCDIVLSNPDVALVHVRLAPLDGERYRLIDLAGQGVTVNGKSASQAAVGDGDTFAIVGSVFRIEHTTSILSDGIMGARSRASARPSLPVVSQRDADVLPDRLAPQVPACPVPALARASFESPSKSNAAPRPTNSARLRPGFIALALGIGLLAIAFAWINSSKQPTTSSGTQKLRQSADTARVLDAETAFGRLLTNVEENGIRELLPTVEAWAAAFGDVVDESEIPDRVRQLEAADRKVASEFLRSVKPRIDALLELKSYDDAGKAVAQALTSTRARGDARATLEALGRRAEFGVGHAIEGLQLPELSSRPREALGTVPANAESRISGENPGSTSMPTLSPTELVEQASQAVARADFEEAETRFNLAAASGGAFEAFRFKAATCRSAALAKTAVIARLSARRPIKIAMADGASGSVIDANSSQIAIEIATGAQVVLPWDRLPPSAVASLARGIDVASKDWPNLASWLVLIGENDTALLLLARYCAADPLRLVESAPLIAEGRRIPLPAGGFTLVDGVFKSAEERVARADAERFTLLRKRLVAAGPTGWQAVADEMRALLPDGRAELDAGLKERALALRPKFESALGLTARAKEATRAKLFTELEERRKQAMSLIDDTRRYPYPYLPASEQSKVQGEVDDLVQRVRDLWETPASAGLAQAASKLAVTVEWRELLGVALAVGASIASPEDVLLEWDRKTALRTYTGDSGAKELLDHAADVDKYNASLTKVILKEERDCHNAVNTYRVMMGRRAVMIDERLVLAARGHSDEMVALKYFAHDSPVKERKSPSDRARLAGWGGGVSENIAAGMQSGEEAVRGWIHSSGHHRNLLGAGHTHLGCGCNTQGWTWTQNFGKGSARPKR